MSDSWHSNNQKRGGMQPSQRQTIRTCPNNERWTHGTTIRTSNICGADTELERGGKHTQGEHGWNIDILSDVL